MKLELRDRVTNVVVGGLWREIQIYVIIFKNGLKAARKRHGAKENIKKKSYVTEKVTKNCDTFFYNLIKLITKKKLISL